MRPGRASIFALLGTVAVLSLGMPSRAMAQENSGAATSAATATVPSAHGSQMKAVKSKGAPRDRAPLHMAVIDEESPWIAAPAAPPETFETAGILQCVPYARFLSGIGIRGDAWTWWDKAAGIYARGNYPEPGAVLSFPGIDRMPLGHVAVVRQVLTDRKILVEHANWPNAVVQHGAISRDILVLDVSPANDWTEVRVQFGEGGPLGSVYPANGFIYEWNEAGVRIAQPRFSLDYALWAPKVPSVRMFNAIAFLWALPPAERKKAYAAAGVTPDPSVINRPKPVLALGSPDRGRDGGGVGRTTLIGHLAADLGGLSGVGPGVIVLR
jgi:surface antigen